MNGDAATVGFENQLGAGVVLGVAVEHTLDEIQVEVADYALIFLGEGMKGAIAQLDLAFICAAWLITAAVQNRHQASIRVRADPSASVVGSRIDGLLHSACGIVIHRGEQQPCQQFISTWRNAQR